MFLFKIVIKFSIYKYINVFNFHFFYKKKNFSYNAKTKTTNCPRDWQTSCYKKRKEKLKMYVRKITNVTMAMFSVASV